VILILSDIAYGLGMETKPLNRPQALDAISDKGVTLRLLKRLKRNTETGCWEFQGYRDSKGYGQIKWLGKAHWVHRIAYAIFKGPIEDGMSIDHSFEAGCRSKSCCNPDHLVAMTLSENSKLRWEKCRH